MFRRKRKHINRDLSGFELYCYYIINSLEILFACFFIYGMLCKLFKCKVQRMYCDIWKVFKLNLSTFSTTSSVFIAICLAIFPILLSMDSNSILIKLDRGKMIKLINEIGEIFILSLIFVLLPLVNNVSINYFISMILLILFSVLVLEIVRIMLYFYAIIYNGTKYRKDSIKSNDDIQQHILDLSQKIFENQRNNH